MAGPQLSRSGAGDAAPAFHAAVDGLGAGAAAVQARAGDAEDRWPRGAAGVHGRAEGAVGRGSGVESLTPLVGEGGASGAQHERRCEVHGRLCAAITGFGADKSCDGGRGVAMAWRAAAFG